MLAERWLDPELTALLFAAQLCLRLERLGPTCIKLGQILAEREDMLPHATTDGLKFVLSSIDCHFFQ